jgi:hypothetical protein
VSYNYLGDGPMGWRGRLGGKSLRNLIQKSPHMRQRTLLASITYRQAHPVPQTTDLRCCRNAESMFQTTTELTAVNQRKHNTMTCTELARHIERLQPNATPQDVARLCLLLANTVDDLEVLRDQRNLQEAWKRTGLKLQVATDQHAAMTEELENLAASDPERFTQDQIWILIRAIKVQSQVLQMYVGHAVLDV